MTAELDLVAASNLVARRESLLEFVRDATSGYQVAWFHRLICDELTRFSQAITRGERPRMVISLPPRHGKSTLSSRCFPAWHLGHNPGDEVMLVSYSSDLANSFSYECRDIVRRDWYRETFPAMRLSEDRASVVRWRTTAGGQMNPVGIFASLTGHGADVLLIDDVFKGGEQAMSPAHRQKVWDHYTSSIYSRLSPKAGICVVNTRWHDDDLTGRLLARSRDSGDRWKVLTFPAIATRDEPNPAGGVYRRQGDALHPERFPLSMLEQIRAVSGPHDWASLYQQDPSPEGGDQFIKRADIRRFDLASVMSDSSHVWDAVCISWDTAFKTKVRSDRTACCIVGRKGQNLYLLHAWAGKLDFPALCDRVAHLSREWSVDKIHSRRIDTVIESRANGMGVIRYLEAHAGIRCQGFDPQLYGSKTERANISAGWFSARRFFVPGDDRRYPWAERTISAWLRFPTGAHDDEVDCMSQAVIWLQRMGAASINVGPRRPSTPRRADLW